MSNVEFKGNGLNLLITYTYYIVAGPGPCAHTSEVKQKGL